MRPPPASSPDDHVPPWNRAALLALGVVLLVGLAVSWACRFGTLTVYGDDPIYYTLSQSLAGGHYRDEFLIGSPPHAQYPPGMAIYLLILRTIGGESLDWILAVNLVLVGVTIALTADAVRRLTAPWVAVAAAALLVFNPQITLLSRELRSEIPFLLFASLSLWLLLLDSEKARRWFPALAVASAIVAFMMRSAGIALIPAVAWALLLRKQWRPLIIGGVLSLVAVVAWFAYTRWASANTIGHSYAADLGNIPGKSISHIAFDAVKRARAYFSGFAGIQFAVPDIPNQPLDNGIVGMFLALTMAWGTWMLRRRWASMAVFLTISLVILLVFPWQVSRLLSVLLPWLVVALLVGIRQLTSRFGWRRADQAAIGVAGVLAAFGGFKQVAEARLQSECRRLPAFSEARCATPEDRGYVAAAEYVRDSLPESAVVAASKPASLYQISQRKAFPLELFRKSVIADILAPKGPVTTILLSRQYRIEGGVIAPRLLARCSTFRLLYSHPTGALLLGVSDSTDTPHPESCAAMEAFIRNTIPEPDD